MGKIQTLKRSRITPGNHAINKRTFLRKKNAETFSKCTSMRFASRFQERECAQPTEQTRVYKIIDEVHSFWLFEDPAASFELSWIRLTSLTQFHGTRIIWCHEPDRFVKSLPPHVRDKVSVQDAHRIMPSALLLELRNMLLKPQLIKDIFLFMLMGSLTTCSLALDFDYVPMDKATAPFANGLLFGCEHVRLTSTRKRKNTICIDHGEVEHAGPTEYLGINVGILGCDGSSNARRFFNTLAGLFLELWREQNTYYDTLWILHQRCLEQVIKIMRLEKSVLTLWECTPVPGNLKQAATQRIFGETRHSFYGNALPAQSDIPIIKKVALVVNMWERQMSQDLKYTLAANLLADVAPGI